jgi:hypothetical protein
MRRSDCAIFGSALWLLGCTQIAGIESIRCEPACKDETTRIFCDTDGKARPEACPPSTEECAAPACEAGACTFKPAVGAPCGEGGRCNEGFACLGLFIFPDSVYRHTCLVAADGKIWCWGDNEYGQLGDGTTEPGLHPVLVRGLPGPADRVHVGYGHTCATLRTTRDVHCWGNNQDGQCGSPPSEPISEPVLVDVPGVRFIDAVPGNRHTCAVSTDNTVYCWGNTEYGQCGSDPALTGSSTVGPTKLDITRVGQLNLVKDHTCVVRSADITRSDDPSLVCWGSNSHVQPPEDPYVNGKLGPKAGDRPYSAAPLPVDLGLPAFTVGMGPEATYAGARDRNTSAGFYAWGENDQLELGIGSLEKIVRTPTAVLDQAGLAPLAGVGGALRSGGPDQCVRMADRLDFGAGYVCWGTDDWGELGAGTQEGARTTHPFPIPMEALPPTAGHFVRGEDHTCAAVFIAGSTEVWCFGRPGVLGNGTSRAADGDSPNYWKGASVVWDPANFAAALVAPGE